MIHVLIFSNLPETQIAENHGAALEVLNNLWYIHPVFFPG